jgi:3-hydroxyacyl-CoA dehydrogenase/enoyl-CoA hydratase/3-hydroxybutyryl-CoA epimerase
MEIKKEDFPRAGDGSGPKTIVATNTSALCRQRTGRSDGFARARDRTAFLQSGEPDETGGSCYCEANIRRNARASLAFVRQIGKLPVIVRDSPGFLVNRVLFPYLLDAAELFEAGVDAERNRRALGGMGNADGSVAIDR